MSKIAIVILNYKVKDDTLECIESIKNSDYKDLNIIVVDNNSEDGLGEELAKIDGVEFIQTGKNLGYTGGNNVGIKKALRSGADYILILNPDTLIKKDAISILLNEGKQNLDVGIFAPKILLPDKKTLWYAGGIFDMSNVLGGHRGVNEKDQGQYEEITETDYATGAAMFIRKTVFGSIGLFDEDYFLYYEDSDFCLRARNKGFKIMYIPRAIVYHKNAHSTGLGSPLQDYFITRNRMLFASKFLPFRTKFALFREALKNIRNSVRRLALFDFLISNFGKGSYLK